MRDQRSERLSQIIGLVSALHPDRPPFVETHAGPWRWMPSRNVIQVNEHELVTLSLEAVLGIASHETSHSVLTRSHLIPPWTWKKNLPAKATAAFSNALLDSAIDNGWIPRAYPGAAMWVKRARMETASQEPVPHFLRFGHACITSWMFPELVVPDDVVKALAATERARREYIAILPRVDLRGDPVGLMLHYRYRREVIPILVAKDKEPITDRERLVRLHAVRAHALAQREIVPAAEEVWERDVARIAECIDDHRRSMIERIVERRDMDSVRALVEEAMVRNVLAFSSAHISLARRVLELYFDEVDGCCSSESRGDKKRAATAVSSERPVRTSVPTYEEIRQRVEPQIQRLSNELAWLLEQSKRRKLRRGFPSGRSLDLRRCMSARVDRHLLETAWKRRELVAHRGKTLIHLLVDASGSMADADGSGEAKIDGAVAAAVLIGEALARTTSDVRLGVSAFQDVPFSIVPFGDTEALHALAELPWETLNMGKHNKAQWNDDPIALRGAVETVLGEAGPLDNAHVWIISDGHPAGVVGREATARALHRTVAEIRAAKQTRLVAIGIGDGTAHVRTYYGDDGIACVPVEDVGQRLADLLRRTVT
jgi:hypothetical protein